MKHLIIIFLLCSIMFSTYGQDKKTKNKFRKEYAFTLLKSGSGFLYPGDYIITNKHDFIEVWKRNSSTEENIPNVNFNDYFIIAFSRSYPDHRKSFKVFGVEESQNRITIILENKIREKKSPYPYSHPNNICEIIMLKQTPKEILITEFDVHYY